MTTIIRNLKTTQYKRPQSGERGPFMQLPNLRIEPKQVIPDVVIEGVPPVPQKREIARNET